VSSHLERVGYTDPGSAAIHRVSQSPISSPTYLLYLQELYVERFGLRWSTAPHPLLSASAKVRFRLGGEFGLRLLSDPSLAPAR
jgi:hypothetical protein